MLLLEGGGPIAALLVVIEVAIVPVGTIEPVKNVVDVVTVETSVDVEVPVKTDGVRRSIVDSS